VRGLPLWKWIDIPPLWLGVFVVAAWGLAGVGPRMGAGPVTQLLGGLLIGAGVLAIVLAGLSLSRAKTTVIPHLQPTALVTDGIYGLSRNPIYLGDALVLAGLVLRFDGVVALVLVPLFVWVITDRFIRPEEERLRTGFGPAFDAWARRTRRWV
jgi:protein-S-isoprenylcysteine O-methyltransferase Ste14